MDTILVKIRVALGISLLVFLTWYFDLALDAVNFTDINLGWLTLAAFSITLSVVIGGFNLNLFVSQERTVPFLRFLPMFWVSWAFSLVVPGQLGDIASLPVLLRKHGFDWHTSLGRIMLDKLLSLLVIGLLALWGIFTLLNIFSFKTSEISWAVCIFFTSIILISLGLNRCCQLSVKCGKWLNFILKSYDELRNVIVAYPTRVVVNFILTWLKVFLVGVSYWAMFAAYGYSDLSIWQVIPLMAASSLVAYLPISFNGLGTVEIAGIVLFSILGIPEATILAVYLTLRIAVLCLAWVPSSIFILYSR